MVTESRRPRLFSARFVTVTVAGALYFLALGVTLPIVPQYVERELGGGSLAVGVGVGSFAVGAVLLRPFAGRMGDRAGRRILIVAGAFTVGISTLAYVVASGLGLLVVFRFVGGLGEAAFFVGAGTMVADLAPPERRGEAISYWSIAVYSGISFGPAIGEGVLDARSYDAVWIVSALLALASTVVALGLSETLTPAARAEARGRAGTQPLLARAGLLPGVVLFLGLCGLAGYIAFVPLYVDDVGLDDSQWLFLLYGVLILVIRVAGARLPDALGPQRAGTGALALGAIGMTVIAAWGSVTGLVVGTIVFAAGMSLMYPSMITLGLTGIDESARASVLGTVSMFFDLSQGLGAAILGVVAALAGYRGAFAAGGVLAAVGLILLWSGLDPRVRRFRGPVRAYEEIPEPEPGA